MTGSSGRMRSRMTPELSPEQAATLLKMWAPAPQLVVCCSTIAEVYQKVMSFPETTSWNTMQGMAAVVVPSLFQSPVEFQGPTTPVAGAGQVVAVGATVKAW